MPSAFFLDGFASPRLSAGPAATPSGRDDATHESEKETHMTEHTKPLSFNEIYRLAWNNVGEIIKLARMLETVNPFLMSTDSSDEEAKELARTSHAIQIVMQLLGATPNAYINREALDALQRPIERAVEILAMDWAIELLKQYKYEDPNTSDSIPF
jgi:hypothetical protein